MGISQPSLSVRTTTDVPTEGSRTYAIIVCIFASLGGIFFGYDQGVTGGAIVMRSFLEDYCVGYDDNTMEDCKKSASSLPDNWRTFTTLFNVMYYLGCFFGAAFGGYVADKFGRRMTIFTAGVVFCGGTTWVVASPAHKHAIVLIARVVQGMGVGNSSFSLPIFGAEAAPKELRGMLSGFMQMMVVIGLFLANVVNIIVKDYDAGWRITFAVALAPPVVVLLGIFCVPESPRWMYQHKGREGAEKTLQKLRQTDNVRHELNAIGEQLELEGEQVTWKELFSPSMRRRVFIAVMLQVLQQTSGVGPVLAYGGQIFKDVLGDGIVSLLIMSVIKVVSTVPAMYWVDAVGRRKLLLLGAAGMAIGHLVCALSFIIGCDGDAKKTGCSKAAGVIMLVAACFFVFNFAISWGPVAWIYPAEIFPLNVRAKAVSLSTMGNWGTGAIMLFVPKLFPYLKISGVFFLFFALCTCCGIFVYFFCPETRGILLEDIEALFNGRTRQKNLSPRYVEAKTPDVQIA